MEHPGVHVDHFGLETAYQVDKRTDHARVSDRRVEWLARIGVEPVQGAAPARDAMHRDVPVHFSAGTI
jgi:hypothetical protein